jgi:putative addiction module component (TIGR02574 family)
LELVEEIWDGIASDAGVLPLSGEQREEIERRIAETDADPSRNMSWEDFRTELRGT